MANRIRKGPKEVILNFKAPAAVYQKGIKVHVIQTWTCDPD